MRKVITFLGIIGLAAMAASCQLMSGQEFGVSAGRTLAPAVVGSAGEADPGPVVESATGAAHLLNSVGILRRVSFNVRRYADGSVDGELQLVAGASIIHCEPTCFTLDGNLVRIAGIVENALFVLNVQPGSGFVIQVSDEGEGSHDDGDTTSRIFFNVPIEDLDNFCETGDAPGDLIQFPLTSGNVQIHE